MQPFLFFTMRFDMYEWRGISWRKWKFYATTLMFNRWTSINVLMSPFPWIGLIGLDGTQTQANLLFSVSSTNSGSPWIIKLCSKRCSSEIEYFRSCAYIQREDWLPAFDANVKEIVCPERLAVDVELSRFVRSHTKTEDQIFRKTQAAASCIWRTAMVCASFKAFWLPNYFFANKVLCEYNVNIFYSVVRHGEWFCFYRRLFLFVLWLKKKHKRRMFRTFSLLYFCVFLTVAGKIGCLSPFGSFFCIF